MFYTQSLKYINLLRWYLFRLIYVRFFLNWAWDPDKFELMPKVRNIGLFKHRRFLDALVGGVRLIFPHEQLEEVMLFGVPSFKKILKQPEQVETLLRNNIIFLAEATRFLMSLSILRSDKKTQAKERLMGALYVACRDEQRPIVVMVVNPWLLYSLQSRGFVVTILGEANFPAKNRLEEKNFGEEVPHFAIALNLVATETVLPPKVAARFGYQEDLALEKTLSPAELEAVRELWEKLEGLSM